MLSNEEARKQQIYANKESIIILENEIKNMTSKLQAIDDDIVKNNDYLLLQIKQYISMEHKKQYQYKNSILTAFITSLLLSIIALVLTNI